MMFRELTVATLGSLTFEDDALSFSLSFFVALGLVTSLSDAVDVTLAPPADDFLTGVTLDDFLISCSSEPAALDTARFVALPSSPSFPTLEDDRFRFKPPLLLEVEPVELERFRIICNKNK